MKEPKTMTHHDYKEVWCFLYKSGMPKEEIPNIGIEAWREAKKRGFVEPKNWGWLPTAVRREMKREKRVRQIKIITIISLALFLIASLI